MRIATLVLAALTVAPSLAAQSRTDPPAGQSSDRPSAAVHVPVGSPLVDGSVYQPHVGRVIRLRIEGDRIDTTAVWTNTLVIGDSAGRPVHRWHTSGWSGPPGGARNRFDLWSTFDGKTLALLGWHMKGATGFEARLAADGRTVRGTMKPPSASEPQPVEFELPEAGFASGAADLIPYAVGLREGLTMTFPLWSPPGRGIETQTWTVTKRDSVSFDGRTVPSWVMEHFDAGEPDAKGRIWFVDEPPYVVRWDLFGEEGVVIRMIGEPAG